RAHAERTAAEAMGLPPVYPVRGYKSRLAMLFALDFPILTMAFVAVTQASPIVAAGSAIALSLFLVLGAHSLGGPLRELARHVPAWGRHLATVVIMLLLLASVIGVTVDLRIKGFDVEGLLLGDGGRGGVFGDRIDSADTLPEPFRWAIVRAAGLVTLLATVFGISWSYRQHSPQAAFARAEVAYQRALRRHARSMRRLPRKVAATIVATAAIILAAVADVKAAACSGPTVLALVDTTTAYDDQDRAAIMPAVEVMVSSLPAKSRLTIRTVRDAASSSRLLFDACTPVDGHMTWNLAGLWRWLINDPATLRIERVRFIDGIRDVLIPEFHGQGDAERTALIDTLAHHAGEVDRLSAIWLFTDLLESVALPMDALLSSSASLHDGGQSLPPLSGVDVHVAGIGRFHDRARRPLSQRELGALIGAWTDVIQAAGGTLHLEGQT
ncbi:MAG: hypothetical protein OEU92_15250, partial [Alphaproteobacteria bacterium]|nr:hypothetical protein [Alphaproteobacteria bacterium]